MVSSYQISSETIAQIKLLEGFRPRATPLGDGRWAVGYGHVASTQRTSIVTRAQADLLLRYDLNVISEALSGLIYTPLNSNQIDGLGSFIYNVGLEAFATSDVLRLINAGALLEAASAMEAWCHATVGGRSQEVDGLIRRRAMEKALFLKPEGGWVPVPSRLVVPYADPPCLSHDSTVAETETDPVPPRHQPENIGETPDAPVDVVEVVAAMAVDPAAEASPEAVLTPSQPTEAMPDPDVIFPATSSVARRAVQAKSRAKSRAKSGRNPVAVQMSVSRILLYGLIAAAGVASIGAAISLGLETPPLEAARPEFVARLWTMTIVGLSALAFAIAQLMGMINPNG